MAESNRHHQEKSLRAEWVRRARHAASQERFVRSAVLAALLAAVGFAINIIAIHYATDHASNSVTDIILSNIPVFNVDELFVYGTFILTAFVALILLMHPKRIPFTLNALGFFWIVRSILTSLTHVAPFATRTAIEFGPTISKAFFGSDQFFSAHTGVPFLFALIFWREKALRYAFLAWSLFFAVVVLLGHLHYSIDVAAAFFMTYSIYCIIWEIFPRSRKLFYSDPVIR